MADGRVIIETKLDTSGLESGAKRATNTVKELGEGMQTAGSQGKTLDSTLQGLGTSLKSLETLAKSSVVVKLAQTAMKVISAIGEETSVVAEKMKAASTLFGDVAVDQEQLLNNLYKISSETGESMEVLGQSVYDALSASVEPTKDMANVLKVVSNSAKLAKGGFTDTSTALSATLTVINAYKLSLEELDSVQSMLLQTQNKGVTTVGELGDALASVTPTAASFGVKFSNIAASLALMTKQGTNTRVATTALAQVISELGKSGTTASENLQNASEKAGLAETSFKGLLNAGYSLGQILEIMNKYAESNGKSMVDMFSSVEAGRATLQLVGDNAEDFNEILASMDDSAGLVAESFEKTVVPSEQLSASWSNLLSKIGTKFKPATDSLALALAGVIDKMAGQEVTSQDLTSALETLKTATAGAKVAQEELKKATDETTESQYQQSLVALYDSVRKVSEAYKGAVKQLSNYKAEARDATTVFVEASNNSKKALEEAKKLDESITYEKLIEECVQWEQGLKDLAEIFPYVGETQREILAESVLYVSEARSKYKDASNTVNEYVKVVDEYVQDMADLVNQGVLSLDLLGTINKDLADAVSYALQTTATSAKKAEETIEETSVTATESLAKEENQVEEMNKAYNEIIESYKNTLNVKDALGESIATEQDKIDDLNKLYTELVAKYGETSDACRELKARIVELNTEMTVRNDLLTPYNEMEEAYDAIIKKSENLASGKDALGNSIRTEADLVEDLNDLYVELAEKYGETSYACIVLKGRVDAVNKATEQTVETSEEEKSQLEEMEEAYSAIIAKRDKLTDGMDGLGNAIRTQEDELEELNNLYLELVDSYGQSSEACVELKRRIQELNKQAENTKAWKSFENAIISACESAVTSLTQGVGSAIEELTYQLATIPEQLAEIDAQISDISQEQSNNLLDLQTKEMALADAKARGNAKAIKQAEEELALAQEKKKALELEKKSLEENRKATADGSNAWKSAGKVALEALASVLEGLGAQLAAQAVVQAIAWNWVGAGIATAGSVAAYIAAGLIKAQASKYEQGGIIGGSSRHGDQILARVNSGELILNTAQQENLARVIEAAAVLAQTTGGSNGITINFEGVNFYGLDEPAVGKAIYENIRTLQYEGVI